MVLKGLHQKGLTLNRWEMQGNEKELTFDLNRVNFGARSYNPTIGRFDRVDSFVTKFANFSPYIFKQNNPCNLIDIGRKETLDVN